MSELTNALHEISTRGSEGSDPSDDFTDLIAHSHRKAQESEKRLGEPSALNQLSHYGFSAHPFSDSVNPNFFYGSSVHEAAFKKMMMTVEEDISLGLVHGVSGTGKTLLTQMLLTHLDPEKYRTVLALVSPGMSKTSLLKEILRELVQEEESLPAQTQSLLDLLHEQIIQLFGQGKKLVTLIDEAHFLSAEALHVLRTISNLETPQKKLSSSILFSEDFLLRRLSHPSYESLRNRMYMKVALSPLDIEETRQYIKFRLLNVGCKDPLFDEEVYPEIHKQSGGVCREINRICHNSLAEAYLRERKSVDREILKYASA